LSEVAKGAKEFKEIPRSQRFLTRPALLELFCHARHDKRQRNRAIVEAVQYHGYSQKEVADHFRLHHGTISRVLLVNEQNRKN